MVARLDSVLAETDLALAQSRAVAAEAAVNAIAADLRDAERILARVQTLSQKSFASEADLTKAEARRRRAARAARARRRRSCRPRGSTRSAAPPCSTSTRSARRSAASWSSAAPSPAR